MASSTLLCPSALLTDSAGLYRRLRLPVALAVLMLGLTACSESSETGAALDESAESQLTEPPALAAELNAARMGQWTRNCALCHVRGEGGAPVLGDREAWAPRLEQGEEVLLQHTVEGINNMPPLGYCMDCETADFLVLIRFMGGEA